MNTYRYIGIAGLILGIISFTYAVYVNRDRKKLSDYIQAQSWHLYSKANNASGYVQLALDKYKKTSPNCMDLETLEWLSKADAFGQDVLKDVIRQIQVSEPVFSSKTINRWAAEGRIAAKHAPLFELLTPANQPLERDDTKSRN